MEAAVLVDFGRVLVDLEGMALEFAGAPLTLGVLATRSLLAALPGDEALEAGEKLGLVRLARKVHRGDGALAPAELMAIAARISQGNGVLVAGLALEVLLSLDDACEAEI